jgi:ribose transport system ATP-binding protein
MAHRTQAGTAPSVVLAEVSKSYGGVDALRGATLNCLPGEVHGLIGENGAGKSTLIKILSGAVAPDSGRVVIDGGEHHFAQPFEARRAGIGTVYQELSLIGDLSVAANLFYGEEPRSLGRISVRRLRRMAAALLAEHGFGHIDVTASVRSLRLAERQCLEIVKTLRRKPKVLVLDEATSALLPEQVEWLFAATRRFTAGGGLAIFISHRLAEVRAVCDRVTVFRAGKDVATGRTADFSEAQLVEVMLGRKVDRIYPPRPRIDASAQPVAELRGFSAEPRLKSLDLAIQPGEVVGIGGLEGQGQADLFLGLIGARATHGEVLIDGRVQRVSHPATALTAGIALVPEDRAAEGLCLPMSIASNIALGNLAGVSRWGVINRRRERELVADTIRDLQINVSESGRAVAGLSGGNQQKVLLGRVLTTNPNLLLLFDATRGVDVGTKAEIYRLVREQGERGVGVLFYSSDAAELANFADRVVVLHDGRIRADLRGTMSEEDIVAAAVGAEARPRELV